MRRVYFHLMWAIVLSWSFLGRQVQAANNLVFTQAPFSRHSQPLQIPLPPIQGQPSHLRLEYSLKAKRPHYFVFKWADQQGKIHQDTRFLNPADKQSLLLPLAESMSENPVSQNMHVNLLQLQQKESLFLSHLPYDAAQFQVHRLAWYRPKNGITSLKVIPQDTPADVLVSAQSELKSDWQLRIYEGNSTILDWPLPDYFPSRQAEWHIQLPHAGLFRIEVQAQRKNPLDKQQKHSYSRELPYLLEHSTPSRLKTVLLSADQRFKPSGAMPVGASFVPHFKTLSNTSAAFQVALHVQGEEPESELKISLDNWQKDERPLEKTPFKVQIYRGGFVYTVAPERYYIPESEGYHADPLLPLSLNENQMAHLRLSNQKEFLYFDFYLPAELSAGEYTCDLLLEWQGQLQRIPLRFEHFQIQAPEIMKTAISLYPEAIAKHYPHSTEAYTTQTQKLLWEHGISPDHLYQKQPLSISEIKANEALTLGQGWRNLLYWDSRTLEQWPQIKPQLDQSVAYIRQHNLSPNYYFFVFDEATSEKLPQFQRVMQILKRDYPEFTTLSTSRLFRNASKNLLPQIDEWVPVTQELDFLQPPGPPFRWWYQLLVNHAPYANWFLESPLIETRILFWQAWLYRIDGLLYYTANRWFSNSQALKRSDFPYTDWNPRAFPDTNGDGYLIYPGPEILPSIRLKAFRTGQQDYALLKYAEKKLGRKSVEEKVKKLITDLSHYERQPHKLTQIRTDIIDLLTK